MFGFFNLKNFIFLITTILIISCKSNIESESNREESIRLNNMATDFNYMFEVDSIRKSIDLLNKAIELDEKNEAAYGNKIASYIKLGEVDEAYKTLITARKKIEEFEYSYVMEYLFLKKLNKHDKAKEVLKEGFKRTNDKLIKEPKNSALILEKFITISILSNKEEAIKEISNYYKVHDSIDIKLSDAINIINSFDANTFIE